MRRGCISLGDVQCARCHRTVQHSDRYLAIDEDEKGEEAEKGKVTYYCVPCSLEKGYAYYKDEGKGEKILTFFPK